MRNIGAVVLAAGGSSRLGRPKQLLTFRGETFIRRAVRAAAEAGCDPIVVVAGEINDAIRSELDIRDSRISSSIPSVSEAWATFAGLSVTVIQNAEWRRGVGTSIRCGLEQLPKSVAAAVLLTCDQPFVDAAVLEQLMAARERTGKPIIASSYANTLGVPALYDRSCFEALLALPETSGAKGLILSRRDDVAPVPFEQGAIDIDTPEDFERLKENCD